MKKKVLCDTEMSNLALLHVVSNSCKSNSSFPWVKFPERESTNFESSNLIVASNVDVGAAYVNTVIAKKLSIGIGSVAKAFIFDAIEIGARGYIEHLICLPSTSAYMNVGCVSKLEIVSIDDLITLALKTI